MTEAPTPLTDGVHRIELGPHALQRSIGIVHQQPITANLANALVEYLVQASSDQTGRQGEQGC